jgi:predicted nucleic acid-binding protein
VISPKLLDELTRALAYPKLRRHIPGEEAQATASWISDSATTLPDPDDSPPVNPKDADDDYLVAIEQLALVSGDKHLLDLAAQIPVFSARDFLGLLGRR